MCVCVCVCVCVCSPDVQVSEWVLGWTVSDQGEETLPCCAAGNKTKTCH